MPNFANPTNVTDAKAEMEIIGKRLDIYREQLKEVQDLTNEIQALKGKQTAQEYEVRQATDKKEALLSEISSLQAQVSATDAETGKAKIRLREIEESIVAKSTELPPIEERIKDLIEQAEAVEKRIVDSQSKRDSIDAETARLMAEFSAVKEKFSAMTASVETLARTENELKSRNSSIQASISRFESEFNQLESRRVIAESKTIEAEAKLKQLEQLVNDKYNTISVLDHKLAHLADSEIALADQIAQKAKEFKEQLANIK